MLIVEIIVVLALFVLNGFFAMAELAIVSSRRAHLERLAKEGQPGASVALVLASDPARMLAAVQIGFTTSAMLAGIFSGATLAERIEEVLLVVPILAAYGKPLSIVIMTIGVTYTALVIGELAPKYIALNNPELIAIRVAQPLAFVARVAAPVIWLLNGSARLLLRLLHLHPRLERALTEDDIHYLVAEGARLGVIHNVERDMIEGVLDLADSPVRTIMTPRPRVQWVDLNSSKEQILNRVRSCPHAQRRSRRLGWLAIRGGRHGWSADRRYSGAARARALTKPLPLRSSPCVQRWLAGSAVYRQYLLQFPAIYIRHL
jgi:putative hemolysin